MAEEPIALVRLVIDNEPPGGSPPGPPDDGDDSERPVWCSDDALAAALSLKLGENWLCVQPGAAWYRWTGKVWQPDHKRRVVEIARRVCRSIANGLPKDSLSLKRKISSRERAQAALSFASTDPRHACAFDEFDRDPFALNTPIGIVDLRTGQLRTHSREARLTKITAVAPEGDCPTWLAFEREITGEHKIAADDENAAVKRRDAIEYRDFLRAFAGYSLTGSCEEEIFVFLYGKHGNTGKTTWQTVLRHILGDYAIAAPINIFIVTGGERHPTELADFRGARLVIVGETGKDDTFDEAKLKWLTGRDSIRARFMRMDFFEFEPTHKLCFAGNHLPALRSGDHAMRRRTRICPFDHPHNTVDRHRADALKAEGGGILKLLIEAAVKWQGAKLGEPKAVREATDRYFEAANPLRRWLRERCELGKDYWGGSAALYADFEAWSKQLGEKSGTLRKFVVDLDGLEGVRLGRRYVAGNTSERGFEGLRLKRAAAGPGEAAPLAGVDDPAEDWPCE